MALSGVFVNWGTDIQNGLLIGAESPDSLFSIEFQDDQCEPRQALSNFSKFLSQKHMPIVIMGCMENINAVAPLVQRSGAIMFAMGGMSTEILAKNPNMISLYSLVDSEVRFLLPYLHTAKVNSLAIVTHSQIFGEQLGASLEASARSQHIDIPLHEKVATDTNDFRSLVSKIIASNPDAVFIHVGEASVGTFIRQLRDLHYQGKIFATSIFESEEIKKTGGSSLSGTFYTYPVEDSSDPDAFALFAKKYRARFHQDPNINSAIAYDSAVLLNRAIQKCSVAHPACLIDFFRTLGEFRGAGGKVLFGPDRSALRPFGIKQYQNGKYVWIEKEIQLNS